MAKSTAQDHQDAECFALQEALSWVPERSQGFARSLLRQHHQGRTLTDKQREWVRKLGDAAIMRAPRAIGDHVTNSILMGAHK